MLDHPLAVLPLTFVVLSACAWLGVLAFSKRAPADAKSGDFEIVLAATLTLLGLIIGFSFSMAVNRYDQRKNYEEAEANAIGTEYARAGLLPAAAAAHTRLLLKRYLERRILFYTTRDREQLRQLDAQTVDLQQQLWSGVEQAASAAPTPVVALAVWGMNDVLNSQSYTQAAWWNRIPTEAWELMALIAMVCNGLFGYTVRGLKTRAVLLAVLPLVVALSFFLIADIDSPRDGMVLIAPQNLIYLASGLR